MARSSSGLSGHRWAVSADPNTLGGRSRLAGATADVLSGRRAEARSATHKGSVMQLEDFGHKRPDAPPGGGVRVDGRATSRNASVRVDHRAAVPVRRPAANSSAIRARGSQSASGRRRGSHRSSAPLQARRGWGCCYGFGLRRSVREPDDAVRRPRSRSPRRGAQSGPAANRGPSIPGAGSDGPGERSPIDGCPSSAAALGRTLGGGQQPQSLQSAAVAAAFP